VFDGQCKSFVVRLKKVFVDAIDLGTPAADPARAKLSQLCNFRSALTPAPAGRLSRVSGVSGAALALVRG